MTGKVIVGREAAMLGLVNIASDNIDEELCKLKSDILGCAPLAQRLSKEAIDFGASSSLYQLHYLLTFTLGTVVC